MTELITDGQGWERIISGMNASQWVVLTDENTKTHCLPRFESDYLGGQSIVPFTIPAGDDHKTLTQAEQLWEQMMEQGIDRHAVMICLGGGMVCDLGGFVASSYKRGIRTLYVPTTNLAMCDAALGGKTGVNFHHSKNQIGTYHQPEAVLIDTAFLDTLPERERRSGFSETIKHALIASPELWSRIQSGNVDSLLSDLDIILESAQIKLRIAAQDVHDQGIRQALNFGHTIGHAMEAASWETGSPLLHGEAILFGMMAETWLSVQCCGLDQEVCEQIIRFLSTQTNPDCTLPAPEMCLQHMTQDKKNRDGKITCSLIANIGEPSIGVQVEESLLTESIGKATGVFPS